MDRLICAEPIVLIHFSITCCRSCGRPPTFLEMNPFSANRPGSRLAEDVKDADWLVLNRDFDLWNEPNRSREFQSNVPNQMVKEHVEVVGEFGSYLLFHHKIGPKVVPEQPQMAYF